MHKLFVGCKVVYKLFVDTVSIEIFKCCFFIVAKLVPVLIYHGGYYIKFILHDHKGIIWKIQLSRVFC